MFIFLLRSSSSSPAHSFLFFFSSSSSPPACGPFFFVNTVYPFFKASIIVHASSMENDKSLKFSFLYKTAWMDHFYHLGVLKVTHDGVLVLLNSTNGTVWSSNTSKIAKNSSCRALGHRKSCCQRWEC
jgi:hypothetical protein